ncbi:hypothetical protein [Parerythrobacter lacustris]|uniref:UvrD-like helicase ATP-binding domain-containing protein n=1 Tax=Parerythrobacter lacustris TaxID=2969984 RepID=A0ABT1XMW4_9SPHN|nr:hypothetical protein [Parerythrobacter lacustris]MCR2832993.1 hypothetical protein [Parerythrobacter lacustris]
MKALVLTPHSLFKLSQFSIGPEWFEEYGLPAENCGLKRVVIKDMVYFLESDRETDETPLIVVNVGGEDGVLADPTTRSTILERIITVGRSIYTESVSIPMGWRKHQEDCLFSIQASSREWRTRVHFDMYPRGRNDLYVFSRLDDTHSFDRLDRHLTIYEKARSNLTDAVLTQCAEQPIASRAGITLSQRLPQGFVQGATLEQWYRSKLTKEQREFVDKPHDGPVRLRGAAGTGKTLSLVVKFLRDGLAASRNPAGPIKLGFLTHSFASVDLVNAIGESLDSKGLLFGADPNVKLEVRTLYDLAHKNLNFELDQLEPLSLDGREGRRLQAELISATLKELASSSIVSAQFAEINQELKDRWDLAVSVDGGRLVAEIMNEFASVLDAEGVRHGEERGERYAKGSFPRPTWLMALPTELDRRFILEVHRRYRRQLGEMNTLSVDQMIGDFNLFLGSNRWDRIRQRDGYDALFVDELHLFTSIERQTLHKLVRHNIDAEGKPRRPPIFMAYDLKQSPRDTFAQYGEGDTTLFAASTGLQNSELVKLERVFRYTPQIAEFLADLDATFPAIDVPGEWEAYSGKAELADGDTPELRVFHNEATLFNTVFAEAQKAARAHAGGGRRVAVLCASDEQFDRYLPIAAGRYSQGHLPIMSREPSSELRHSGKRFIFSMPEYVAGLQFETVFLIHVDASEAPLDASDGVRRRFISNIYLGSSRAEKTLNIAACMTRGGRSDVLDMALNRHSLTEVAVPKKPTTKSR